MKRVLIALIMIAVLATSAFAVEEKKTLVSITSIVDVPEQGNPGILIGIGSAEISSVIRPDQETTTISGINLMADGDFSFALITSEEVFLKSSRNSIYVEILAEGFHRYEYSDTGSAAIMDDSAIVQKNAVPLLSTTPEIKLPIYDGTDDENHISVTYLNSTRNKVAITFNPGTTKANLIVGTFKVEWKGMMPLDAGIYKAKVNVVYSTP